MGIAGVWVRHRGAGMTRVRYWAGDDGYLVGHTSVKAEERPHPFDKLRAGLTLSLRERELVFDKLSFVAMTGAGGRRLCGHTRREGAALGRGDDGYPVGHTSAKTEERPHPFDKLRAGLTLSQRERELVFDGLSFVAMTGARGWRLCGHTRRVGAALGRGDDGYLVGHTSVKAEERPHPFDKLRAGLTPSLRERELVFDGLFLWQ